MTRWVASPITKVALRQYQRPVLSARLRSSRIATTLESLVEATRIPNRRGRRPPSA